MNFRACKSIGYLAPLLSPIIVFQGGLGNQLSQWSFAHTIPGPAGFLIDPYYDMAETSSRNFELREVFSNCEHVKKDGSGDVVVPRRRFFFHLLDRIWEFACCRRLVEAFGYFREDPRVDQEQTSKIPRLILYAKGYFQKQENVERVFTSVCREIIPVVENILPHVKEKFGLITDYSVIHVRRGDYKRAVFTPVIIGSLNDEYYLNGAEMLNRLNLVLLTEDREDVADLVKLLEPSLIIDKSSSTPWETLALIYGASEFLGSNSSLSWWGARLCVERGGKVWLPSQWSYWKNIIMSDYHFPGCNVADVHWEQNSLETL